MTYVDGFVIAVPTANKQAFIDHAHLGDSVFMELGALRIIECWGDDVPPGKRTDFRRAVEATDDETVVFSWVEWPDKATRDAAHIQIQQRMKTDDRMNPEKNPMPFDGARMIFGGFSPVIMLEQKKGNRTGDYVWYELLTPDAEAAQSFYGKVLGWRFSNNAQAGMDYRIIHAGADSVGGLMTLTPEMTSHGARPAWLGYIAVDNVDDAASETEKRGGRMLMQPMDIPDVGRIAMLADPQGAPFYVIKPKGEGKSAAFTDAGSMPGRCVWNELTTPDQAAAWKYYGEMFGWKQDGALEMGPKGQYQFIRHGAVLGAIMPDEANDAPHWTQYFQVENIDAAKAIVENGGGRIITGPDEIPGGDFAMNCLDPQGALFGLVGPRPAP